MAQLNIPYSNQLKYHTRTRDINYTDRLFMFDKMYLREQYQRGVYPLENLYPNFVVGEELKIQYYYDHNEAFNGYLYNVAGGSVRMANTLHNISGYTGIPIITSSVVVPSEGYWYVVQALRNETTPPYKSDMISDVFYAKTIGEDKDIIKVNFYDTQNSNGEYFFDPNGNQIWNPVAYYTGILDIDTPVYDSSEYTDDNANTRNLLSTPKIINTLTLTNIHTSYIQAIQYQFACDHIYINDVRYARENIDIEKTDKSDVMNVIITLSRNDNDNFQQIV